MDTEPIKRFVNDFFVGNNIDSVNIPGFFRKCLEKELSECIYDCYKSVKPSVPLMENPAVIARINGVPMLKTELLHTTWLFSIATIGWILFNNLWSVMKNTFVN